MGLIVSPDDPNLTNGSGVNASPWVSPNDLFPLASAYLNGPAYTMSLQVIAIKNAGISGLPSVINAAVLLSAFSAGNSDLYASSRTL